MEELQTWWEVPVIAHFCYVFRSAFNLFHFEIEELEAVLYPSEDVQQPCATLEQLIMRILKGCCKKKEQVNTENREEVFQMKLKEHLENFPGQASHSSFLIDRQPFAFLQLREKVELMLTLCEMRLEADDVDKAIRKIHSDTLRIEPVGTDSKQNTYWYFFGVRLYKEDVKLKEELEKHNKKNDLNSRRRKNSSKAVENGTSNPRVRNSARTQNTRPVWSIVCHSLEDWNDLSSSLKKSSSTEDKKLGKKLMQYIDSISKAHIEREHLKRLRRIELGPVRTSSRIVSLKERKLASGNAELRENVNAKEDELDLSAQQAAAKRKAMEERSKRAKLRELRLQEGKNSYESDPENFVLPSPTENGRYQNYVGNNNSVVRSESEESDEEANIDNNTNSDLDSSEEEEDSEESESSSDLFTLCPPKRQRYNVNRVKKTVHSQGQAAVREQNITKVLQHNPYNASTFRPTGGLQFGCGKVKASISYHSFSPYPVAKTPPTYQRNQEQKCLKMTPSPTVISFVCVADDEKQ